MVSRQIIRKLKGRFHYSMGILALILILAVSGCAPGHQHPEKSIFRYNESSGIVNLDPAFSRDQAHIWVCNQLYNGLVQLDDQLRVQPCIAKRWKVSEDGRTYTFYLRQDVYFHDSPVFENKTRMVTASDFEYSFLRLADPATASPGAWVLSGISREKGELSVRAVNDTTLTITLKDPFPPFLGILGMQYCSVVPREAVDFYGGDFRKNPVGTGPFYLKNWEENIKMVLQRNARYFEYDGAEQLPLLDAVSISFLADKMTAFLEFTKENLEFISGIDPSYKDEILSKTGALRDKYRDKFYMLSMPYLNTEYLGILVDSSLLTVKNSPLNKKAVRQAINYGFDREKMIRYLRNGIGTPGTKGMIPAGMPAFDESTAYGYYYDPEKSKKLIREAGYNRENPVPQITLVTTSEYLDLCKFVQAQLKEVGISLNIEVSPPAAVIERRAQSRINFFRASWIADYPDEENYLSLFYSKNFAPSGPNYTHFSNRLFDSLYRAGISTTDAHERLRFYKQMDSLVMEEAPVVVLYYDQAVRFVNKRVEGMTANPINLLNLKRVSLKR